MKLGGILALSAALALTACAPTPPPVSDKVQAAYESGRTVAPRPTPRVIPVSFSAGTKTVMFGDSWTAGLFLPNPKTSFAYQSASALGLDATVAGGSGTGYLNEGAAGQGTYNTRLAAMPVSDAKLLVIQGSVNDLNKNLLELGPAFDKTIATARAVFPTAQIVILGPATSTWPAPPALARVDDILGERSANAGLAYISPYVQQWITTENYPAVIDKANAHPSPAGHAYLASKLEAALNSLKAG